MLLTVPSQSNSLHKKYPGYCERRLFTAEGKGAQAPPSQPRSLRQGKLLNVYQCTLSLLEDDSKIPYIKLINFIKRVRLSGVGNTNDDLPILYLTCCKAKTVVHTMVKLKQFFSSSIFKLFLSPEKC